MKIVHSADGWGREGRRGNHIQTDVFLVISLYEKFTMFEAKKEEEEEEAAANI